jgi:hypothetical protein
MSEWRRSVAAVIKLQDLIKESLIYCCKPLVCFFVWARGQYDLWTRRARNDSSVTHCHHSELRDYTGRRTISRQYDCEYQQARGFPWDGFGLSLFEWNLAADVNMDVKRVSRFIPHFRQYHIVNGGAHE